MPYTVVCYEYRKPGMPLEDFKNFYENEHVPLLKEILGKAFPTKHTRYYVKHNTPEDAKDPSDVGPPLVFYGKPEDIRYDCIVVLEFDDVPAFIAFKQAYEDSPRKQEMDENEAGFILKSELQAVATEDACVTVC
jgi:hypothetical protein